MTDVDGYRGLFGAFPYAFRRSDSRLFRSYVLVGGLLGVLLTFVFGLALVGQIADTNVGRGGTFSFARAFYVFVGLLVVFPVVAPVLSVARRHRRRGSTPRQDFLMALAGYVFLLSLYVGLVVSMPDCFVIDGAETCPTPPSPLLAPLYDVPDVTAVVPPALASVLLYLVHRRDETGKNVRGVGSADE